MTEKLQQTIKEEIAKLPQEGQDAINASGWEKAVEEIGKKCLLNENQINDLQLETLLVLTGLTEGEMYSSNIVENVETTMDDAKKISDEVLERVFTPITNKIEENIKNNLKNKNPNAEQSVNFILSGGNYSTLIAPTKPRLIDKEGAESGNSITTSPQKGTPPPQGGEGAPVPPRNIPISPKRMTDLRSQFKI